MTSPAAPEPDTITGWTDPLARLDRDAEPGASAPPAPENPAGTIVLADVLDD